MSYAGGDWEDGFGGHPDDDEWLIDGVGFAREGSALRAATSSNPRRHDCPTCGAHKVLTDADMARGYQCDRCADRAEGIGWPE